MANRQRRQPTIHHPQQAMGLIGSLAAGCQPMHPITTEHLLQPGAALASGCQPQQQVNVFRMAQRWVETAMALQ